MTVCELHALYTNLTYSKHNSKLKCFSHMPLASKKKLDLFQQHVKLKYTAK